VTDTGTSTSAEAGVTVSDARMPSAASAAAATA
jgi:hypothetical protein